MTPSWTARARCVGRVEWTSDNPDDPRCLTCGEDKKGRPLQQHCWECARDARAGRKAAAA